MPFYQVTTIYSENYADVLHLYSLSPRKVLKYLSSLSTEYPSYDEIEKMTDEKIEEQFCQDFSHWNGYISLNIKEIEQLEITNTENFLKGKSTLEVPSKPINNSVWKPFIKTTNRNDSWKPADLLAEVLKDDEDETIVNPNSIWNLYGLL